MEWHLFGLPTCTNLYDERVSHPKTTLNVMLNIGQMMQEVETCPKSKEGQKHISIFSKVIFGREGGTDIR